MDTLRSLDLSLAAIAGLLDELGGEIRRSGLQPNDQHLHRIGSALVGLHEIRKAIYAARPELEPASPTEQWAASPDNRALAVAMVEAIACEGRNDLAGATTVLEALHRSTSNALHREIAAKELQRLKELAEQSER